MQRRQFMTAIGGVFVAASLPLQAFAQSATLNVVATTGMIADTATRVGGDLVHVKALMGPGVDPHAYRQTRTDILAMARADLVLWNGLYLEAQMEDFLADLGRKTPVRSVATAVPADNLVSHDDYADRFDPHVWMDPSLWKYAVAAVRDAMIEAAPDKAATFTTNADAYIAELTGLAAYTETSLESIPPDARVLITAHDAFNYFGRAYGFEVTGIQGISTESEAGVNRISELVDMIVTRRIGAVFVESSVSDRSIRALIEGAAAQGHTLKIGGELFSDAMGQPGTYEGTYVGMIDHNATTITNALGGNAPVRGLNGRLSAGS
ncbi:Periplasmic zinc-binding protein TroA precursor [Boseongicola aestuarii]|uniref:Periplasmic zinc-binding protein TroA n=2 Tax=Boseongicola aestuarii TaxID=1470561 RepID=A0A238J262_9RHOB|nr:Periplasmic zinc-binding protein TroA precursor [Boseongicola aestuarii]